jgi:SAM-dependent methyltransferase
VYDRAVPFNHNDHYHSLLLRELPANCRKALDVGCGTGGFARRIARRGVEVDAIDTEDAVITTARSLSAGFSQAGRIRFRKADITRAPLPQNTYDYISCLASIHHVPFETVTALRDSLRASGVLVILGCYRETTPRDWAVSLAAVPVNAVYRAVTALREVSRRGVTTPAPVTPAPVAAPSMSLGEIRKNAATHLPGSSVRRLLLWRYLLVYRNDQDQSP